MRLRLARWLLRREKRTLEAQILEHQFDRRLSLRLDAVTIALEALEKL